MTRLRLLVPLLALCGCGGPVASLWLRVEAPLQVPDAADGVWVKVSRVSDGAVVFEDARTLAGKPFPATLALTTENALNLEPEKVRVEVEARRAGALAQPWARGSAEASLREGRVVEAVVKLCDCPGEG